MRKLTVKCECGQLMRVPRSAVGKRGLCPSCGEAVLISRNGISRPGKRHRKSENAWANKESWWSGKAEPSESAKQSFGEAVDFYCAGSYAEALAVFDKLAEEYPNNPDVSRGQRQCVKAMRRSTLPGAVQHGQTSGASRLIAGPTELDSETVKRVILDKMINASSESAQLQAAELAARLLGMFDDEKEEKNNGNNDADSDNDINDQPDQADQTDQTDQISDEGTDEVGKKQSDDNVIALDEKENTA